MESIAADLKISESKQSDLFKSFEELRSQASSVLVFCLQWKDLETHFDSTRKSLQTALGDLSEREKVVASRESRLESDLVSKAKELERIDGLIEERSKEMILVEQHIDSLKSLVEENREELVVKESEYRAIAKSIAEKGCEFDRVRCCLSEGEEKLLSLEKTIKQRLKETASKGKEVDSIRRTLKDLKGDFEFENRKFVLTCRSVNERRKELESKEEQLRLRRSSIEESDKVIKLKKDELSAIQTSIMKCSSELELKEKRLDFLTKDIKFKESNFVSLKNSADKFAQLCERREKEIEGLLKELDSKEKSLESKFEGVTLFHNQVNDCLREVESREKDVESLKNSVEKFNSDLQVKQQRFRKRVVEFELKQKKPIEARSIENTIVPHSQEVKIEQSTPTQTNDGIVPSSASHQNPPMMEGKDLQLLLNRHLKTHDSACRDIFAVIKASKDPAKLVLDAMEGFFPHACGKSTEFDVAVVRRSCIVLLEQFMQASVQISPQAKEEAMALANQWRAKIKGSKADYLKALGFLHLLTSYQLIDAFDSNELCQLVGIVGYHGQSAELRQALSTADNKAIGELKFIEQAPEVSLATIMTNPPDIQYETMVKILNVLHYSPDPAKCVLDYIKGLFSKPWKKVGGFLVSNCIILLEQLLRKSPPIKPCVREEAMRVAFEWKQNVEANCETSLDILVFLQFLDTYGLVSSFDYDEIMKFLKKIFLEDSVLKVTRTVGFSNKIPEFIQNLIERKKFVDAVRLICAFELTDKFAPVKLLTKHMEDLKESTLKNCKGKRPIEEKEKVTDDEVAALKALRECVEEHKSVLSDPLSDKIDQRICQLDKITKQRRRDFDRNNEKQPQRQQLPWKKRGPIGSGFAQQGNKKIPRTITSSSPSQAASDLNNRVFVPIESHETALNPRNTFGFGRGRGGNLGAGRRF